MLDRRRFVALSSALTLAPILGPHVARAQAAWPSRFVKLIVPFAAGGAADIIARTISNRLSEVWSQQVVVESAAAAAPTSAPPRSRNLIPTATRCC